MIEYLSCLFPLLNLACAIAMVVKFRLSATSVLGCVAFGIFFMQDVTRRILIAFHADVWRNYHQVSIVTGLVGASCLLAAIILAPVRREGPGYMPRAWPPTQ